MGRYAAETLLSFSKKGGFLDLIGRFLEERFDLIFLDHGFDPGLSKVSVIWSEN